MEELSGPERPEEGQQQPADEKKQSSTRDESANPSAEELQARLDSLEAEFLNAWQTLELLSSEYLTMWERLETVELLLYEQQATIARLVAAAADAANNTDDEEFAAKVAAQFQLLESSTTTAATHGGLPLLPPARRSGSRLSADEAFYRSLNSAHRDSPSLAASAGESDSELRMIWEGSSSRGNGEEQPGGASNSVFSAEDYLHYRRRSFTDNKEERLEEDQGADWTWDQPSHRPRNDVEAQDRLEKIRQRIASTNSSGPRGAGSKRSGSNSGAEADMTNSELLHEQLRLAFLESARQKSMRAKATGATAAAAPSSSSSSAAAAAAMTPVDIDPLHLGRSNSSEKISPSFSSYLRMAPIPVSATETAVALSEVTSPLPTSPLTRRRHPSRSLTPQPASAVGDPSPILPPSIPPPPLQPQHQPPLISKSPIRIKARSASEETAKLSGKPRGKRGGLSPTRFNRASSTRSDSGVSSLSGNWSSIDQERSPVISPSKLGLSSSMATTHSSSSHLHLELLPDDTDNGSAPPPPAPDFGTSRMMMDQRHSYQQHQQQPKSPSIGRSNSSSCRAGQQQQHSQQQQQQQQHLLTTETWNVQGSICSVTSAISPVSSTASIRQGAGRHPASRVLSRHDATWMEADDPYLATASSSVLDGDWYSPRGVVHPQAAPNSRQYYRPNTPSPAPGSVPHQSYYVPEPADYVDPYQQHHQPSHPSLTFDPALDELMDRDYAAPASSSSSGHRLNRHPHDPRPDPTSAPKDDDYPQEVLLPASASSMDYYDLYYQSPPAAPHQRAHYEGSVEHPGHSAMYSQELDAESYVYRNPLPSYDELGSYEQPSTADEEEEDPIVRPPSSSYTTASSQVIVSQGGYISIAQHHQRPLQYQRSEGSTASSLTASPVKTKSGPRKKIRSAMSQLMPHFSRPTLKNRSISLPGVDDMPESEQPPQRGYRHHSGDRAETSNSKRIFGRTTSLPGMARKGKKMIKQVSDYIGVRVNKRASSSHSLQEDWQEQRPGRNKVADNHNSRTFVSYCNEGFDLGNDWEQVTGQDDRDEIPSSVTAIIHGHHYREPSPHSTLVRQQSTTSGEFAASRAVGRYRRSLAAAEAAASAGPTSASSEQEGQQQQFLPDVTVVSSPAETSSRIDRSSFERATSEEEASLSIDLISRAVAEATREEEREEPNESQNEVLDGSYSIDNFFPKVALKSSPRRSDSVVEPPDGSLPAEAASPPAPSLPVTVPPSTTAPATVANTTTTRSGRSTRPAPRWQSTEESIDTDDEWYRYGMMQLEEMERRAEQVEDENQVGVTLAEMARQYNQQTSLDNQMQAVFAELKERVPLYEPTQHQQEPAGWEESGSTGLGMEMYYWPSSEQVEADNDWNSYPAEEREEKEEESPHRLDRDDEYSSGETSGPDSPQNQSFDEGGEDYDHHGAEPEPEISAPQMLPPDVPSHQHRPSISSGSRGSVDLFPGGGNILSAAGSTASNIASSVFSFFTSGGSGAKDAVPAPGIGEDSAAGAGPQQHPPTVHDSRGMMTVPTIAVESISPELDDSSNVSGSALGAGEAAGTTSPSIDMPVDEKLLKLTKGSAARWKLVKTLRDKKAEAASSSRCNSPTFNEAVRERKRKRRRWLLAVGGNLWHSNETAR